MRPILFTIFGLEVKSYGFFLALGFLFSITLAAHFAKKDDANPDYVYDISLYILICGIIGARLLEVIVNYKEYIHRPMQIFAIWNGGLTYYGGLIFAVLASAIYIKKKKMDFFKYADIVAPSLALGYTFGRIGCFFAGCCYGKPAPSGSFCLTFSNPSTFAPRGVCLYPTQIYGALSAFAIFIFLVMMRKRRSFKGQLFLLFLILYSLARFIIEFRRDDLRGLYFNNALSTSQLIGIPIFIISSALYFYLRKKNRLSSE